MASGADLNEHAISSGGTGIVTGNLRESAGEGAVHASGAASPVASGQNCCLIGP
jgi:hypothetical protein